ncbi:MAG: hypothetical protein WDM71_01175 [Ferruginibacter sp.]
MYRVEETIPYIEFPNTIHVDFYGNGDSLESKLDAHYAKYKEAQSIVFLKDSVRVENIPGIHCIVMNCIGIGTEKEMNFILISRCAFVQKHIL